MSPFFIGTTIKDNAQLLAVRTGFPVSFLEQESALAPPATAFPLRLTALSPWENPTKILWVNLAISILTTGIAIELIWRLGTRIRKDG